MSSPGKSPVNVATESESQINVEYCVTDQRSDIKLYFEHAIAFVLSFWFILINGTLLEHTAGARDRRTPDLDYLVPVADIVANLSVCSTLFTWFSALCALVALFRDMFRRDRLTRTQQRFKRLLPLTFTTFNATTATTMWTSLSAPTSLSRLSPPSSIPRSTSLPADLAEQAGQAITFATLMSTSIATGNASMFANTSITSFHPQAPNPPMASSSTSTINNPSPAPRNHPTTSPTHPSSRKIFKIVENRHLLESRCTLAQRSKNKGVCFTRRIRNFRDRPISISDAYLRPAYHSESDDNRNSFFHARYDHISIAFPGDSALERWSYARADRLLSAILVSYWLLMMALLCAFGRPVYFAASQINLVFGIFVAFLVVFIPAVVLWFMCG
ncbi:hypothetical protein VNI00_004859 [Paramarasmius palmivorus]|uniref:Uncharacterized protein n=1 Tax=Paramarasmius palmivorus TaxID=297713 RepID=A0AAW0DKJ4_9AGAR